MLFVAAEETLEPEDGPSSNIIEPGDKVESSFVLLSLSTDTLVEIDPKDFYEHGLRFMVYAQTDLCPRKK